VSVTVTMLPAYPIPGRAFTATFAGSAGNYVRVFVTSAPTGSKWATKLRDEALAETQVLACDTGKPQSMTFDRAGSYVCTIREYTRGTAVNGGGYADDPAGYISETLEAETSYTFVVGQRMTGELVIGAERGTLVLYVWGSTIRPTTYALHGEVSPRIDASTDRMRTAVATAAVVSALTALENVAASSACSDLATVADNIVAKFNAHLTQASVHNSNDTDNGIGTGYVKAGSEEALKRTVGEIIKRLRQHMTNDSGSGPGSATTRYHDGGTATPYPDWANVPIVTSAGKILDAGIALAACWHAYESHRVSSGASGAHDSTDSTNTLTALPALLGVYKAIVAVLASANPTAPATDNAGATLLVHRAGLVKA
jgi:hypothetical protein